MGCPSEASAARPFAFGVIWRDKRYAQLDTHWKDKQPGLQPGLQDRHDLSAINSKMEINYQAILDRWYSLVSTVPPPYACVG